MIAYRAAIILAGLVFWLPIILPILKGRARIAVPAVVIAAAVLILAAAGVQAAGIARLLVYLAALFGFSLALKRLMAPWADILAPEAVHAAVGILLFAGFLIVHPVRNSGLVAPVLLLSPTVMTGQILAINVLRGIFYETSALGTHFIIIPVWWKSLLGFLLLSAFLTAAGDFRRQLLYKRPAVLGAQFLHD